MVLTFFFRYLRDLAETAPLKRNFTQFISTPASQIAKAGKYIFSHLIISSIFIYISVSVRGF